jgi:hypothetical protein
MKNKLITKYKNKTIYKIFDSLGNWEYILMIDGIFTQRSYKYETLQELL